MLVVGPLSCAALGSLVGVVVGAVEILQRYRDAPFRAACNVWGIAYVVLNAAVSYGAFWVLYHWGGSAASDASGETDPLHLLGLSAGAGFGGAALIRARLATVRLPSGQEFGFGPVIVIETLLSVVDRQLDRQLAAERYHTVHKLMKGIDFDRAKERLPKELLLAMQSVPEVEAAQLARPIDEMDRMDDLSSQDKSYLLGYYLLDLVGKDFLASVLEDPLRRKEYRFAAPAWVDVPDNAHRQQSELNVCGSLTESNSKVVAIEASREPW